MPGYTLSSVGILIDTISATSPGSLVTATINEDASGVPGTLVCTLDDPATFTASSVNTFTAPATCPKLGAQTTYHFVLAGTGTGTILGMTRTSSNAEDGTPASGWSVVNGRTYYSGTSWASQASTHMIVVKGFAVDNTAPELVKAELATTEPNKGRVITLVFDEGLTSLPSASAFTVMVGGSSRTVTSIQAGGSTILGVQFGAPAAQPGETVTVSYTPPATNPLQDAAGNEVAAFTTGQSGVPAVVNNLAATEPTPPRRRN